MYNHVCSLHTFFTIVALLLLRVMITDKIRRTSQSLKIIEMIRFWFEVQVLSMEYLTVVRYYCVHILTFYHIKLMIMI